MRMGSPDDLPAFHHAASARVIGTMRERHTFQLSVDTEDLPEGLAAAAAALDAGVTLVEIGTPLIKSEGARRVVPAFRERFPGALLLADLKTMDGGTGEARMAFAGGANVVDFLALAGADTARAICSTRDDFRRSDPEEPRLVFADILLPHQGAHAPDVALGMLAAGADGIVVHLQHDARTADPDLSHCGYLAGVVRAVREAVGLRGAAVQAVGGLTTEAACALARETGVLAFVISTNLGAQGAEGEAGLDLPEGEIRRRRVATFMERVRAAGTGAGAAAVSPDDKRQM